MKDRVQDLKNRKAEAKLGEHPHANGELTKGHPPAGELSKAEEDATGKLPDHREPGDELPKAEQQPDPELGNRHDTQGVLADRHDAFGDTPAAVGVSSPRHVYPGQTKGCRLRSPLVAAPANPGRPRCSTMRARLGLRADLATAFSALSDRHDRGALSTRLQLGQQPQDL